MARTSPLHAMHEEAEATFLPWGDAAGSEAAARVPESFGEIGVEYAAIRKGAALFDWPHRGCVRVTGADRVGFLNRMLTQELKNLRPFEAVRSFWLNRKGRIDADLRVIELPGEMILGVDVLCAAGAAESLASFVFSEDAAFADASEAAHWLALHGPEAPGVLARAAAVIEGPPLTEPARDRACRATIAGREVVIDRQDALGEAGYEILVRDAKDAPAVYGALLEAGGAVGSGHGPRVKRAGWHAFNTARIEAGVPVYHIDFGPESLPAETGVLRDRVSFTKGCYLGQEVVARMQSLGHPKQLLVGLRLGAPGRDGAEWQPGAGARVVLEPAPGAEATAAGAITSSARSPMLGDAAIAFAAVRWEHARPGTRLMAEAPAGLTPAIVTETLAFWERHG